MRWSWKIGEVRGIAIYLHGTFLILLLWVALGYYFHGGPVAAIAGLIFITALFGCILLHELGHALTARRFRIRTREITLLPIGGLSRLERMPEDPREEVRIALAGPATSIGIALALALLLFLLQGGAAWLSVTTDVSWRIPLVASALLAQLVWANLVLAAFNLLPAFPMDGGRVLRAFLAQRMEYARATLIAASIGQGMALLFGLLGLLFNPFLLFIALFIYMGAAMEAQSVELRALIHQRPVREAMVTEFETLAPTASLAHAAARLLAGMQVDFPVVQEGLVVGMLSRSDLVRGLAERGREAAVAEVMQSPCATTAPGEALEVVFQRMQETGCAAMPVVDEERLVGLLTLENIGEFMMVQAALDTRRSRANAATEVSKGESSERQRAGAAR
jgi:Zn-dependent protease/CBS domain-containing protein